MLVLPENNNTNEQKEIMYQSYNIYEMKSINKYDNNLEIINKY